ncbi:hypothetical protein [Megasphaera sp.]|uniref:hypothetical protein n=1 Tax=Megasphaera sp. TaxID=2023260 RepID=UPI0025F293EE|nr:hypothetical protein [uncultured Megasphaera sp.]
MSRRNKRKKEERLAKMTPQQAAQAKEAAAKAAEAEQEAAQEHKKQPPKLYYGLERNKWIMYLLGFAALAWSYYVLFTRNWSDIGFAFTVFVTVLWPWSLYKNCKKGLKKR